MNKWIAFIPRVAKISFWGSSLMVTLLTNLVLAGMGLISGTMAARLLGPQGRGELTAIQTWPHFLSILAALGLSNALVYFSAQFPDKAGRYLSTTILVTLFSCVPFALLGYLLIPVVLSAQLDTVVNASRQYLWFLPVSAVVNMFTHPLRGVKDINAWNFLRLFPNGAWVMILIAGQFQTQRDPGILSQWYLFALFIAGFPMAFVLASRLRGGFQPDSTLILPMLRYGFPTGVSNLSSTLNLRLDQMVLALWFQADLLGWYVVAVAWSNAVSPLLSAVAGVLMPHIASSTSIAEQKIRLLQGVRLGGFLTGCFVIIVTLLTPWMIPILFGPAFSPSIAAGMILSVAAGFLTLNQILAAGALGIGKSNYVLIAETSGLASTIVFLSLFIWRLQIIGAALASLLSYVTITVVFLFLIKRQINCSIRELIVPTSHDVKILHSRWRSFKQQFKTFDNEH